MKAAKAHGRPGPAMTLAAAVLILAGMAVTAGPASADSGTVNEEELAAEIGGDAEGIRAQTGQANTFTKSIVIQKDVQVDAAHNSDVTQNSSNIANVSQTDLAASGDATVTGDGSATSGDATASSFSFVHQMNIQIVAGPGTCTITQDASNTANVGQTAVAVSGDATSSGAGSATSGDAEARNRSVIKQKNVQVYVCKQDGVSGAQTAANTADVLQNTGALSGDATSSGAGSATSGDADASSESTTWQTNAQRTIN